MIIAGLGTLLSGYYIFFNDRDDLVYLFAISLILLTLAFVFQHQIDQLVIKGTPQKLDPAMRDMLMQTSVLFGRLPKLQQAMTEDRMVRWLNRKEFINKHDQDAPEDVKYILAWYAILLTLHQEKFLYEEIDRIVFYYHPFLTPSHMEVAHIAELETTDGTLIISVPHLIKGHMEKGYYNIALHTMAEAYAQCFMKSKPAWPGDIWERLEAISSISREKIEAYIGLPVRDPWPVAVHHQLTYTDAHIPEVIRVLPIFKHQ